ncbi:unnamed protein product [Leuciscus chuanchicus]
MRFGWLVLAVSAAARETEVAAVRVGPVCCSFEAGEDDDPLQRSLAARCISETFTVIYSLLSHTERQLDRYTHTQTAAHVCSIALRYRCVPDSQFSGAGRLCYPLSLQGNLNRQQGVTAQTATQGPRTPSQPIPSKQLSSCTAQEVFDGDIDGESSEESPRFTEGFDYLYPLSTQ